MPFVACPNAANDLHRPSLVCKVRFYFIDGKLRYEFLNDNYLLWLLVEAEEKVRARHFPNSNSVVQNQQVVDFNPTLGSECATEAH